ncbi:MAG: hypothetical protein J7M12_01410 [Candidatus Hydrogenedentes bacterium]|nr:hypothetical protein [Candidatus Hydrogenedentota bacterium]
MRDDRQFSELRATAIYCPKCKRAMPVRDRLLLVLPNGEMRQYVCSECGSDLGTRTEKKRTIV